MSLNKPVLLLVGRTGNGKSSTGNTILGMEVFKTRGAWDKAIHDTPARGETGSFVIIDGSGIGDTGEDLIGGETAAISSSDSAFELCGETFTAIILVLKYGVRFTKQEKDAVRMIKFLFGEDVLKKWGIIVMTYGDNFEKNFLEEDKTELFKSWCNKQEGDFKSVYEECNKICELFNNRAKEDDDEKVEQLAQLFRAVDKIKNRYHGPYTEEDFNSAEARRFSMLLITQMTHITEECAGFLNDVNNRQANIGRIFYCGRVSFKDLLDELDDRVAYLRDLDHQTGLLVDLIADVTEMKGRVERTRHKQRVVRGLIMLSISLVAVVVIILFVVNSHS